MRLRTTPQYREIAGRRRSFRPGQSNLERGLRMLSRPGLLVASLFAAATAAPLRAQESPFFYPVAATAVRATKNVQYGRADTAVLRMDVYRPRRQPRAVPALIFLNGAVGAARASGFYVGWANAAAANGLVAIVPDLHGDAAPRDIRQLIDHLYENANTYGIDREALAVYAGSGNVYTTLPIIEDPAQTRIRAAVIYYGTSPVTQFRRDLPLLYVRAGLDRPGVTGTVTSGITAVVAQAIAQNAPITVINDPGGHHAFEMVDDDAATRDVMNRTIDFVKRATSASYQAALHATLVEAAAAAQVVAGDFGAAAPTYARVLETHPNDERLRLSYGEALLGDKQYGAACAQFDRLRGKGLGARDLGLPAARACMLSGDAARAIAWLRSIPKRFLPASVAEEAVFASLQGNPEFRALFAP